jgi:hypothetical protein
MAQVTISYEEYQDLLANKTKREQSLEEVIKLKDEKYWEQVEIYQKVLVQITKYDKIDSLNSYLRTNHKVQLRHYFAGSARLERVDIEHIK